MYSGFVYGKSGAMSIGGKGRIKLLDNQCRSDNPCEHVFPGYGKPDKEFFL
jgi:hypothetical protein